MFFEVSNSEVISISEEVAYSVNSAHFLQVIHQVRSVSLIIHCKYEEYKESGRDERRMRVRVRERREYERYLHLLTRYNSTKCNFGKSLSLEWSEAYLRKVKRKCTVKYERQVRVLKQENERTQKRERIYHHK